MTTEEIHKLYEDDAEFKKFVDSESDRRVNQARETWEKKLPAEAEKLANLVMERREKESAFRDQIKGVFIDSQIPVDLGFNLLGDVGADIPQEELESRIKKVDEQYKVIREEVVKGVYKNNPTPRQSSGTPDFKPMEAASSKEILENLDRYQVKDK